MANAAGLYGHQDFAGLGGAMTISSSSAASFAFLETTPSPLMLMAKPPQAHIYHVKLRASKEATIRRGYGIGYGRVNAGYRARIYNADVAHYTGPIV